MPLALVDAEDAAALAELATEEVTELKDAEAELIALEPDVAAEDEAEDALADAELAAPELEAEADEDAADTSPKTPPPMLSGWLLPLTEEAADL